MFSFFINKTLEDITNYMIPVGDQYVSVC